MQVKFIRYCCLEIGGKLVLTHTDSLHVDSIGKLDIKGSLDVDCFNLCAVESRGKITFCGSIDAHTARIIEFGALSNLKVAGSFNIDIVEVKPLPDINSFLQYNAFLDTVELDSSLLGINASYDFGSIVEVQMSQEKHFEVKGKQIYTGILGVDLLVLNTWFKISENTWDLVK